MARVTTRLDPTVDAVTNTYIVDCWEGERLATAAPERRDPEVLMNNVGSLILTDDQP